MKRRAAQLSTRAAAAQLRPDILALPPPPLHTLPLLLLTCSREGRGARRWARSTTSVATSHCPPSSRQIWLTHGANLRTSPEPGVWRQFTLTANGPVAVGARRAMAACLVACAWFASYQCVCGCVLLPGEHVRVGGRRRGVVQRGRALKAHERPLPSPTNAAPQSQHHSLR